MESALKLATVGDRLGRYIVRVHCELLDRDGYRHLSRAVTGTPSQIRAQFLEVGPIDAGETVPLLVQPVAVVFSEILEEM